MRVKAAVVKTNESVTTRIGPLRVLFNIYNSSCISFASSSLLKFEG